MSTSIEHWAREEAEKIAVYFGLRDHIRGEITAALLAAYSQGEASGQAKGLRQAAYLMKHRPVSAHCCDPGFRERGLHAPDCFALEIHEVASVIRAEAEAIQKAAEEGR